MFVYVCKDFLGPKERNFGFLERVGLKSGVLFFYIFFQNNFAINKVFELKIEHKKTAFQTFNLKVKKNHYSKN